MATKTLLKLKKSAVSGKTPLLNDLSYGELAINYYDGKLFYRSNDDVIKAFYDSGQTTTLVQNLIDSDYIQARSSVDSASVITLINQNAVDSADVQSIVDSDYVNNLIDSATINAIVNVSDVVDSDYVNGLVEVARAVEYTYQPTSDRTVFQDSDINGEILSYSLNQIDVYLNGIRLSPTLDYTATNGTSVTLQGDAAGNGDTVVITGRTKVSLADQEWQSADSSISTAAETTIDQYATANFRTAKYLVQMATETPAKYHATEVLLIHNGSVVNMTEYGSVMTDSSLGDIDADISGGTLNFKVTPHYDNTEIKIKRILIQS